MKKIAFLSHLDLNLYLFRLPIMEELRKKGYKVYAVAPRGKYLKEIEKSGIETYSYTFKRGSVNPLNYIIAIRELEKILKEIKPEIVHTFTHQPNIFGSIAAKRAKVPYILNLVEGLGSNYIGSDLKSLSIRTAINLMYRYIFKISNKVFFVNNDDPKYFLSKKILDKNRVIIIKSVGINTKEWRVEDLGFRMEDLGFGVEDGRPVVLMIARVIRDKGVKEYIEAANRLKERAVFLYVGDIDKGNKNSFSPEWGCVKYLGFRRDIKELISICDIFVLPSYREGVPRTLLEAASLSKPIVTTDAVGCREVVEDGTNGFLVPVKDAKTLSEKIERLIDSKELREKFGKAGRVKAETEFDIKVVVDKYISIYEEILGV